MSGGQESGGAAARGWALAGFMVAASLGNFIVQLDVSIVNLSLSALRDDLHVGVPMLQWIVNAYSLSFSVALLSAGVLGDRFGHRNLLLLGYAVFALGSLACGLAPSVSALLAARFFQGLGAAIVVPNSLAAINAAFRNDAALRVSLLSIWIASGGVALTGGPIIGGLVNSVASWRWIFLINLPACALGLWATARHVAAARPARRQDWAGQGLILGFSTALLLLIIDYAGLSPAARAGLLAAAAAGFALWLRVERRCADPAIPLGIFRHPGLRKALVFGGLVNFAYFGIVFFASLHFRGALAMTPLQAGLAFIPISLPLVVGTLLSGHVGRRQGPERAIGIGFSLMIPGLAALALPGAHAGYLALLPGFALATLGIGFVPPMITAIAMQSVGPEQGGMISAVVNFFRQIAGAFGVAVFGLLASAGDPGAVHAGFAAALWALAGTLMLCIALFRPACS